MHRVLGELRQLHHVEFAYMTGSGTAAIYLALQALGLKNRNIAIPNNVCYSVPTAVILSENRPVYIDVNAKNWGLSVDALKNEVDIQAVIAVHSYGFPCDIDAISSFCREVQIPLIEDCAVSQGASIGGRPVGSMGDVSILSFGAGKIIDVGHGGAVLTNSKSLLREIIRLDKELSERKKASKENNPRLGECYKQLYNRYYLNGVPEKCAEFRSAIHELGIFQLNRFDSAFIDPILSALRNIAENLSVRESNTRELTAFLSGRDEHIVVPPVPEGAAVWRANLFVEKRRNDLFKHLLSRGYKISSWYPSVSQFFDGTVSLSNYRTPVSDSAGEQILNIWVNQEIDSAYLRNISGDILQFFQ